MKNTPVQCKSCRKGYPCICDIEGYWAAHCMFCECVATKTGTQKEKTIADGKLFFVPYPFRSKKEATTYWNKWNRR